MSDGADTVAMDDVPARPSPPRTSWRLRARRIDRVGAVLYTVAALAVIAAMAAVILFLAVPGLRTFGAVRPWQLFFGTRWAPDEKVYGLLPFIVGSLGTSMLALAVSLPVGLVTAVFLVELAPRQLGQWARRAIELLASIPSVVYGFLGLTLVVPWLGERSGSTGLGMAAAAIVLSIMALPTVVTLACDAIEAQPRSFREASLALGATRWQTIWRVIVPAAKPGLWVAALFGFARAVGETMAVQMVIGNAPVIPHGLISPTSTMSTEIVLEMGNTRPGTTWNDALFTMALLLLVVSMALMTVARRVAKRRA